MLENQIKTFFHIGRLRGSSRDIMGAQLRVFLEFQYDSVVIHHSSED